MNKLFDKLVTSAAMYVVALIVLACAVFLLDTDVYAAGILLFISMLIAVGATVMKVAENIFDGVYDDND